MFLLDFAQGIEELPGPIPRKLMTSYRDLLEREVEIPVLPLEVLCAEKLAIIVDRKRKEPRDIYDLWSVLSQVKNFDCRLFLACYHKTLSYSTAFSIVDASFRDRDFKEAWEVRLRHQVPRLPGFDVVVLELTDKLKRIFEEDQK